MQEEEAEDSGAGTGLVPSGKIFVCGAPSETEEYENGQRNLEKKYLSS